MPILTTNIIGGVNLLFPIILQVANTINEDVNGNNVLIPKHAYERNNPQNKLYECFKVIFASGNME